MSRQILRDVGALAAEQWHGVTADLAAAYQKFRETRIYVQIILSAALVGTAGLAAVLPIGPLATIREALDWVVTFDYNFAGQAARTNAWARGKGGWVPAIADSLIVATEEVRTWVAGPAVNEAPPPIDQPTGTDSAELIVPTPVMPVDGAVLFGFGWPPPGAGDGFHEGIDLVATAGSAVMAVMDGTVVSVRDDALLGQVIEIIHGTVRAVYCQVESIRILPGQQVRQSEVIAAVARSSGLEENLPPHLHFEVRALRNGAPIDPAGYLGLGGSAL